ncbi:MAG: hypothetical protein DMG70_30515 [Acidobacteria bacterium]|nr:MAG: hypothetical protein DMG70_30515 [Acidobacteriota bacterium]PYY06424.1 MAG: hypothetical protein DMG69_23360 [Acidobacteriota bacterium]
MKMLSAAAPADFAFGLARMFQTLAEDSCPNFNIVRSRSQAYRLVGLDDQEQQGRGEALSPRSQSSSSTV